MKQDFEMIEQEVLVDILKNPKKYEHKAKISQLIGLISEACELVNHNPDTFEYDTFRKPLDGLLHLCVTWSMIWIRRGCYNEL